MSYVYAEIVKTDYPRKGNKSIEIYSDTKVSFDPVLKTEMDPKTVENISNFGLIKSLNIGPKINISFAGNDFLCITAFLANLYAAKEINVDALIEDAYKLHRNHQPNGIELIISMIDEEDNPSLVCIKNNKIESDCPFAYIGSESTRKKQLELKNKLGQEKNKLSTSIIMHETFSNRTDDAVGSFYILCKYSNELQRFIYPNIFFSSNENIGYIAPNQTIPIYATAENGGYTFEQFENMDGELILDFKQVDFAVVYTRKLRLKGDVNNQKLQYLLLPIKYNKNTREIL